MRKLFSSSNNFWSCIVVLTMMMVAQSACAEYVKLTALAGIDAWSGVAETHEKLVDANINTRWGCWFDPSLSDEDSWPTNSDNSSNICYIIVKAEKAVNPEWYFLVTGHDTGSYPGRNWASWKIYGGNFESDEQAVRGGEGWTLLDDKQDEPLPAANFASTNLQFDYAGTETFQYFWIEVEKTVADADVYQQMSEWGLGTFESFQQYFEPINFVDANVKAICVANWDTNWDTNGDGELSYAEAAAVTDLGEVFKGNTTITSFDELQYFIGLTSIGGYAFRSCNGLTSVTIPNSVTSIGREAFSGCSGLTSITIPNSVTSIGGYAFSGCSGLTSVTIPNSVTSIGISAFGNCRGLTSIKIPSSVTSIHELGAFGFCTNLTTIVVEEGNSIYDSRNNCNAIIETSSNRLIAGCKNTTIPNSVTTIGNYAFDECIGLTSITIPNSVTAISRWAFYGCSGLTSITIPTSVTSIEGGVFAGCTGLTSIAVEEGNTTYDSRNNCNAIIETSSNTLIAGCKNSIIPSSVTNIGSRAFSDCTSLTSVTIPSSVTSIGAWAFHRCTGLTSIAIPNSVTSIGESAFYECSGLTSVTNSNSVTSIGRFAFSDCIALTFITIPNSVTSIGEYAFENCSSLTSIKIPNSVTSIGDYAFSHCSSLTSVTVMASQPLPITEFTFSHRANATLYVPAGSKAAYEAADYWKEFNEIIATDPPQSEYEAAMAAITDGEYYFVTEVNGIKWYVTQNGYMTAEIKNACSFAISKVDASDPNGYLYDTAFLIDPGNGAHFSNPTPLLDGKAYLHLGFFYQDDHNDRGSWERQVFYLKNGKLAIRACNTPYGETSWLDAGRAFWSWEPGETEGSIIPCYSYEPAYVWTLESSTISFADANVKAICVDNWDTNSDGELSYAEAAAVTDLGEAFRDNTTITAFDELQYFTGLASIGAMAFYNCTSLTSITIPNNVTTIDNNAFDGCFNLTFITIPNSVMTIDNYAFSRCICLTSITIPGSVTSIGENAFRSCSGLTSITIPNSVTTIGESAFYECSGLTSITIPGSVTSIGYRAFAGCSDLTTIVVEEGNTIYDSRNNCNAIIETSSNTLIAGCKNTTIPNSVTTIGNYAFDECIGLTSITIPNSVTAISRWAFYRCSGLTSITIPNSMTSIGRGAFGWCTGLTTIVVEEGNTRYDSRNNCNAIIETLSNTLIAGCKNSMIPNSVTSIGESAFFICSGLTSIAIPNSVTSIGESAFYMCSGLTYVTNSNSVTSIGDYAFSYCSSLTSITIPNCVTSIGQYAFWECSSLTKVVSEIEDPFAFGQNAFCNISDDCVLTVPAGTRDAYIAAGWTANVFKGGIVESTMTDISQMDNAIYVEPMEGKKGDIVPLEVRLKNAITPVGCSFKLILPEGFTLIKDTDGDVTYEKGERAKKMSVTMKDWNDGSFDFGLTPSTGTATISGNDGTFITFSLKVPDDAVANQNYRIQLTNNLVQSKQDGVTQDTPLSDVRTNLYVFDYILGDVNGDKKVTPSDAIMILYHYFNVEQNGFNAKAADLNGDKNITPADAIEALYLYFGMGNSNAVKSYRDIFDSIDTLDPQ